MKNSENKKIVILCHGAFNYIKNKTGNMLIRYRESDVVAVIDHEKSGTVEYLSHWHGNLTISLVYDQTNWPEGKIPPPLDKVIRFDGKGQYFPIVFLNDWWNLQEDYKPINKTDTTLDIHICLQPLSLMKLQLYLSQSYNNEMMGMLGQDPEEAESDKDAMKKMILETQVCIF